MSGISFSAVTAISKSWNLILSLFETEIQKDGLQVGSADYELIQEKGEAFFKLVFDLSLSLAIVQALAFVSSLILGCIVYRDTRTSNIDTSQRTKGHV